MPFQKSVHPYLAPGVEGGWASANPHVSLVQPNVGDLSDPMSGAWRVGAGGAVVGKFAFADTATGLASNIHAGTNRTGDSLTPNPTRVGFVQRDQVSLITKYLGEDTLAIPPGFDISLLAAGDVWARFSDSVAVGAFVYASYADGSPIGRASKTAPVRTVTATVTSGTWFLTSLSAPLYPGELVSGQGITTKSLVTSYDAATRTAGISPNATGYSGTGVTITVTSAAETPWRVDTYAASGELAKISVWG